MQARLCVGTTFSIPSESVPPQDWVPRGVSALTSQAFVDPFFMPPARSLDPQAGDIVFAVVDQSPASKHIYTTSANGYFTPTEIVVRAHAAAQDDSGSVNPQWTLQRWDLGREVGGDIFKFVMLYVVRPPVSLPRDRSWCISRRAWIRSEGPTQIPYADTPRAAVRQKHREASHSDNIPYLKVVASSFQGSSMGMPL